MASASPKLKLFLGNANPAPQKFDRGKSVTAQDCCATRTIRASRRADYAAAMRAKSAPRIKTRSSRWWPLGAVVLGLFFFVRLGVGHKRLDFDHQNSNREILDFRFLAFGLGPLASDEHVE